MEPIAVKPEEAFRMLGISRGIGYQLLKEGKIPAIKLGKKRLLIRVDDLSKLLAEKVGEHVDGK